MFTLVDYKYSDLFLKDSIKKELHIYSDDMIKMEDGTEMPLINITNTELHQQQFELTETLCSESELRFGSCEASVLKFTVSNVFLPMKDKWITVEMVLDGNTDEPFRFGRYKVYSDVLAADKTKRNIVAYDVMYDIINADLAEWYNKIFPKKDSKVTMKQLRTSLMNHFGLQQENVSLINDDMIIEKTVQITPNIESDAEAEQTSVIGETMSGKEVISSICEINGCFGHIGKDGKFHYIYLTQDMMGLYPSNTLFPNHAPDYLPQAETGHLYPQNPKSTRIGNGIYISADYEDYICRKINKIQIREKENDIGAQFPESKVENENSYIIEDNFLVYGKTAEQLSVIAENIFNKITDIVYRPFSAECAGNPCLEVGDPVRLSTRYELIESYILKRTLKGIQGLRDSYSAEGSERHSEKVNSVSRSIIQLKGKANTLVRNVNETKSELTSFEKDTNGNFEDVRSSIVQTANRITQEVSAREESEKELSSRINQTASEIELSVTNGEKTAGITIKLKNEDGEEIDAKIGTIAMDGIVTFRNLTGEDGETRINGGLIETGTVSCNTLNGGEIKGQKIVGGEIEGASISATDNFKMLKHYNLIHTGYEDFIQSLHGSMGGGMIGMFSYVNFTDKFDIQFSGIVNFLKTVYAKKIIAGDKFDTGKEDLPYGYLISKGRIYSDGAICPDTNNGHPCGTSDYKWSQVFATKGSITTSDKKEKNNIYDISEKYEKLFFGLHPVTYMLNGGDRIHIGIIAQELKKTMDKCNISDTELSAFCRDLKVKPIKKENGEIVEILDLDGFGKEQYIYGVRYEEFIMLNTHMIQKLYKKIDEQQAEIDSLKESVSFLMERIGEQI